MKPNMAKVAKPTKVEETKEERQKLSPIATAERRQKTGMKKFLASFIPTDTQDLKTYIVNDVVIPSIKKGVSEVLINGLDMLFWGQTGVSNRTKGGSKISYRSYSDRPSVGGARNKYNEVSSRDYDYDDVVFDNRSTALEVLTSLDDVISRYGQLSVADMYDLVGLRSSSTDTRYGWTNIGGASVVKVSEGYTLKLPRPMPL